MNEEIKIVNEYLVGHTIIEVDKKFQTGDNVYNKDSNPIHEFDFENCHYHVLKPSIKTKCPKCENCFNVLETENGVDVIIKKGISIHNMILDDGISLMSD